MPTITFGENCDYERFDSILNGYGGEYGWGVRVWINGVIVTARWGGTSCDYDRDGDLFTTLLAWDFKDDDYTRPIEVRTYDITKVEILVNIQQQQRIVRAKTAIEAYAALSGGGSWDEVFSDLLADLMHYADWLPSESGVVFDDALDTARMHYTAEVEENNE
jgi:hypothetical protein